MRKVQSVALAWGQKEQTIKIPAYARIVTVTLLKNLGTTLAENPYLTYETTSAEEDEQHTETTMRITQLNDDDDVPVGAEWITTLERSFGAKLVHYYGERT